MGANNPKSHLNLGALYKGMNNHKVRYLVPVLVAGIFAMSLKLTGCSFGTYTVRFYDDVFMSESGLLSTQRVAKGGDAEPPGAPEREGMTFVEWSGSYTNVQRDLDIYARWSRGDYDADKPFAESGEDVTQDEERASGPNYAHLDNTYRELTIEDVDGLSREGRTSWGGTTGHYSARNVRASCYVDRILRADESGNIALYVKANVVDESVSRGFDTKYLAICGPESMFEEINLGSNITFYGSSGVIGSYRHLNTHWLIFEADYVRVDSRDLEQYVKPNNVDPRK